jgi:hypothetical protein
MLRTRHLLPAVAVAVMAVPAAASAQDFCVNQAPGCQGLAIKANTLQTWLGTAAANGTDDRFFFGPGTIDAGALSYTSNEPIQLIGAGQDQTTLTSSVAGAPTLTLGSGPDASVSGMTIAGTGSAAGALRLYGARASHVGAKSEGGSGYGPVMLFAGSAIDHVYAADQQTWAVAVVSGAATVTDSQLFSGKVAALYSNGTDVTAVRDRLFGIAGVGVVSGTTTVQDTLIDTRGTVAPTVAAAIVSSQAGHPARLVLDRSTIVGDGPGDAQHFGIYAAAYSGGDADVAATNTVVSGFGLPVARVGVVGGPVDMTMSHDAYGAPIGPNQQGDGALTEDHVIAANPRFTNALGGDYTLAAGSPLIDAGTDEALAADATDLTGAARRTDGNGDCAATVDIGAFERAALDAPQCHPAPAPAPAAASATPTTAAPSGGTPIAPSPGVAALVGKASLPGAPRISGLKVAPRRIHRNHKAKVAFALSRRATVAIKITNKKHKTVLKLRLTRSGTLAQHLKLKPGRYTVTATATDPHGLRSTPATARFTVVR